MRTAVSILLFGVTIIGMSPASHAQRPAAAAAPDGSSRVVRVAVVNTPDVLLEGLLPAFARETGFRVVLQITEGVYDLARRGQADLVIAHYGHPGTEAFMTEGLGRWPRMVFSNQAVLIGPAADPAGIRGLADAAEAFRRIAQRGGEFFVNNALTEKYLAEVLWHASGARSRNWQLDLGLRDQTAIEMASQRGAYTLWGIVPFLRLQQQRREQGRPLDLEALVVGEPMFQRVMVSIVVDPDRVSGTNEEGALAFERFLLQPGTQARIRQFRHHGLGEQTWWPAGRNNAGSELAQF